MKFKLQIAIEDEHGEICLEDVINIEKDIDNGYSSGLSLQESKNILKVLQQKIVLSQAKQYTNLHRACSCCQKQRRIKGHHSIRFCKFTLPLE